LSSKQWLPTLALLAVATHTAGEVRNDDPANSASPAPALRYESAFGGYRPWRDDGNGDWKQVNERVREAAAQSGSHARGNGSNTESSNTAKPDTAVPQGGRR
jgi:hypothetical protein